MKVLLIVGCQRSGTTMLGYVFAKDPRTAVLQEKSCLTDDNLRLLPADQINRILERFRAPLVVVKPIVESQRTPNLLAEIPHSRAVWMFRNYQDVVSSNLKRFHSQIEGLRSVVTGSPKSWRNERVSEQTMSILKRFYREDMPRADAAALGWYSRNVLFFEQDLDEREDVFLCKYDRLVRSPETVMKSIYEFWGVPYPSRSITRAIDQASLGRGGHDSVNGEIAKLCEDLTGRLEAVGERRKSETD